MQHEYNYGARSQTFAVWNVRTLANTGQKKWEALNVAAFLTYECQDCDIYWTTRSFLTLTAFANICNWKEPLLTKKINRPALFLSTSRISYVDTIQCVCERGPAAYSAIVAILMIHVKLLHYFDLLFVVFVFPLIYISLCCVDYINFLNLDQYVICVILHYGTSCSWWYPTCITNVHSLPPM